MVIWKWTGAYVQGERGLRSVILLYVLFVCSDNFIFYHNVPCYM